MDTDTRQLLARIFREKTPLEIETRNLVQKGIGRVLTFKETSTGCVEVSSYLAKSGTGYSQISVGGILWMVHRVVFFTANSDADSSLLVLHKCDNPACCRLNHLFAGTQQDNVKDMHSKGRGGQRSGAHSPHSGVKSPNSKLTQAAVDDIRSRKGKWGIVTRLAKEYSIPISVVSDIRRNKKYQTTVVS